MNTEQGASTLMEVLDTAGFLDEIENSTAEKIQVEASFVERSEGQPILRDEPVNFIMFTEDDEIVRLLKELANRKRISREMLARMVGSNGMFKNGNDAYNLEYGLRTKHSMSWKSIQKWCDVLNVDMHVEFRER